MLGLVKFSLHGSFSVSSFYELPNVLIFLALHDAATDYLSFIPGAGLHAGNSF
jgi:hypothetical protein